MHISSVSYKNCKMEFSKRINIIGGNNGAGKSVLLTALDTCVTNTDTKNDVITDITFGGEAKESAKVYYIRQNEKIHDENKIEEKVKEQFNYYQINTIIAEIFSNLNIENDDLMYKLKKVGIKVKNNLQKFLAHRKLMKEKRKIENYIKMKESAELCKKIVEVQDKICQEEAVGDNFENDVLLMKKDKLEKEIAWLKKETEKDDVMNDLERKKVLWREESKLKENLKKYRNEKRVVDLIEVDDNAINAVIAVIGNRLKCMVVDYEEEALEKIKSLRFRQSFIVMDKIEDVNDGEEQNESMVPLKHLVKTKKEYNRLKEFLFKDIYLVKDLTKVSASNKILVTLKGEVLHKSGAISGGYDENKEYMNLFIEKLEYKKSLERLKEIEKELKNMKNSESDANRKELIKKIIQEKEEELQKIKISSNYININLERLKLVLNRLIEQKEVLGSFRDEDITGLEDVNLNEELGRVNKEMREIMISKRIDYEDVGARIEKLFKRNEELIKNKKKIEKMADNLKKENEDEILKHVKEVREKLVVYYHLISGKEETSEETKNSSSDVKKNDAADNNISFDKGDDVDVENNKNNYQGSITDTHDHQNATSAMDREGKSMTKPDDFLSTIGMLSGGQLQILTISLMLSLNDILKYDIVLLDEIDSNLDDCKIQNLTKICTKLKVQIFLITHRKNSLVGDKYFWIEKDSVSEISREDMEARIGG
ncbi:Structural maintenance of chromosome protein 3 [Trachipleistophora hominis]|uniref:Structural maintenance of chromosome protein 3 n=1 Tax=Trachipleistophora hominis TaxID=72359 RepID=L7JXF6_TRAHO|nr:Structural maintenance of chromosome protein 3 [Trachipleistophora hominis]